MGAAPRLFISVTSNLQSNLIGLMYDVFAMAAAAAAAAVYSAPRPEESVPLLVDRNLFPCQSHFPPHLSIYRRCAW